MSEANKSKVKKKAKAKVKVKVKKKAAVKKPKPEKKTATEVQPEEVDLTEERYRQFVQRYLIDFNGKQAAIDVGYSPKTAEQQASRLLRHVKVRQLLKEEAAKVSERNGIKLDDLIREYIKLGFSNISEYVDWSENGVKLKDSTKIPKELLSCISEVSETTTQFGGSIKFKLHDKKGALDSMARIIGAFNDNVNVDVTDPVRELINAISGKGIGPTGSKS